MVKINLDEYIAARDSLMEKDLIAFDGTLFQVLSLPKKQAEHLKIQDREPVEQLIQQTMKDF